MKVIWVRREAEYFFSHGWTDQISLIGHDNFGFRRKVKSALGQALCLETAARRQQTRGIVTSIDQAYPQAKPQWPGS
jgi:hypothetical protein